MWERRSRKNTEAPLGAARSCKTRVSGCAHQQTQHPLPADTTLEFSQPLCSAPCVQAAYLSTWEHVSDGPWGRGPIWGEGAWGLWGAQINTKRLLCSELCTGRHGARGGSPRGGGLAGGEEHTRSLRKESLFVQIISVLLMVPSAPTSEAAGAP